MKSLEELARIREQTKAKIALREKEGAGHGDLRYRRRCASGPFHLR